MPPYFYFRCRGTVIIYYFRHCLLLRMSQCGVACVSPCVDTQVNWAKTDEPNASRLGAGQTRVSRRNYVSDEGTGYPARRGNLKVRRIPGTSCMMYSFSVGAPRRDKMQSMRRSDGVTQLLRCGLFPNYFFGYLSRKRLPVFLKLC